MKNKKSIYFCPHAEEKLKRLIKIGVTKKNVIETIRNPEKLTPGYFDRKIAQSKLSPDVVLRVIYEETNNKVLIVTMYPGKKRRYE